MAEGSENWICSANRSATVEAEQTGPKARNTAADTQRHPVRRTDGSISWICKANRSPTAEAEQSANAVSVIERAPRREFRLTSQMSKSMERDWTKAEGCLGIQQAWERAERRERRGKSDEELRAADGSANWICNANQSPTAQAEQTANAVSETLWYRP